VIEFRSEEIERLQTEIGRGASAIAWSIIGSSLYAFAARTDDKAKR